MTKKKAIVSVTNDLFTDQRVRKVCDFLVEEGYDITLVGRLLKNSQPINDRPYRTKRFKLWFNKGVLFYANYNLRLFFFLLFNKADLLLANDLDTLYANHCARKFKKKCRLIYDSHEYYCGVPELVERPRIQKFWRAIEKRTVPKVDVMYTVNESIADIYRKEYEREVFVVRNISDFKGLPEGKSRLELGLPEDKKVVVLQGAGINIERGAEELIEAIQLVDNAILIFVGDGDVIPQLKNLVSENKLSEKVYFFGKRPYEELMQFTLVSDLGVSLDKDTNINYRFSLPNKIFDYIHAGIPVLVSNLPEVKHVVEKYEVGLVIDSHEPKEIARKIKMIVDNTALSDSFIANTKTAAATLTWANEKKTLKRIYS
ncbi:MAG: glycosyltransferase [Crocinitomicaceae bacterium]